MTRLRGRKAAMAAYTGHTGPITLAEVEAGITDELRTRLTGREYGLTMSAVNKAYHRGRAATGAELLDDAVWVDGKLYPLAILHKLSWTNTKGKKYIRANGDSGGYVAHRGATNDYYYYNGEDYVRISQGEANNRSQQKEKIYFCDNTDQTIVKYADKEVDRVDYYI